MIRRKTDIASNKEFFEIPATCPVCGHPTEEEGKFLICPNDNCPALEYGNLFKWIATLDIKSIGDSIIEVLQQERLVTEPADFYKLTENDFIDLYRMGEKTAKKILKNLHAKMEIDLDIFVAALNIKDVSRSTAAMMISAGYDTIGKMHAATIDELIKIGGIEIVTAEKIVTGLTDKYSVIQNLIEVGIVINKPIVVVDGKLDGLTFCTTGTLYTMKRKEFEIMVKQNGGELKSVSKNLSCLVTNDADSGSSKNAKAAALIAEGSDLKVITEQQFLEMIK